MNDFDDLLIQEGQDLCRILNLTTKVRRLRWLDRAIWSKINSDECRFGADGVLFPDRMKEKKLEPTEWKPIMASSLIFQKILARNMPASFLVTIPLLFLATLIGAGIATLSGEYKGLVFFLFLIMVDGPILANGVTRARKKRRLEADLQAARVVGKDEFLKVLKKIDGLGLDDVMKTEKRKVRSHFSSKPSVAERISNLSSTTLLDEYNFPRTNTKMVFSCIRRCWRPFSALTRDQGQRAPSLLRKRVQNVYPLETQVECIQ